MFGSSPERGDHDDELDNITYSFTKETTMFGMMKKKEKEPELTTQAAPAESPAEARLQEASERARKLGQEDAQMKTRRHETVDELARVQQEILVKERAGDDEALSPLRSRRVELQGRVEDLDRIIATINAELTLVGKELQAIHLACAADRYNPLVDQRHAMRRRLAEVVSAFMTQYKDCQAEGEEIARQQQVLHRAIGLPEQVATPAHLSALYLRDVLHLFQTGTPVPRDYAAERSDWTLRRMNEQGELVAREIEVVDPLTGTGAA